MATMNVMNPATLDRHASMPDVNDADHVPSIDDLIVRCRVEVTGKVRESRPSRRACVRRARPRRNRLPLRGGHPGKSAHDKCRANRRQEISPIKLGNACSRVVSIDHELTVGEITEITTCLAILVCPVYRYLPRAEKGHSLVAESRGDPKRLHTEILLLDGSKARTH